LEINCDSNITLPTEDAYWYAYLPEDYLHLLNCIVVFNKDGGYQSKSTCKDSNEKSTVNSLARRLTSDMYPNVMNNAYFKPSYKTPYYFITKLNVNSNEALLDGILNPCSSKQVVSSNAMLSQILDPCGDVSDEERSGVLKLEIRCGSNKKYVPSSIYVDYLRVPEKITLSYTELENEVDTTKMLEFPEYVCYEIVNECVKLIMENGSDPRLETNTAINQTIGTNVSQNK
jgi:hypothetical protein